jgi:hypothetical protein
MKNGALRDVTPCVTHVRTDVSKELITSSIRVTTIGELGTALAISSNRSTQRILEPWH